MQRVVGQVLADHRSCHREYVESSRHASRGRILISRDLAPFTRVSINRVDPVGYWLDSIVPRIVPEDGRREPAPKQDRDWRLHAEGLGHPL